MLQDNIKNLRKKRGMTQDELAVRLNVVRQTVSKWEKGFSVPDAYMLQKLAEVLEISVSELLGGEPEQEIQQPNEIAQQLSRINEQLAVRNRRGKWLWRIVGILLGLWLLMVAMAMVFSFSGPPISEESVVSESLFDVLISPTE